MATRKTSTAVAKVASDVTKPEGVSTKGIDEAVTGEFNPTFKHSALTAKDALARIADLYNLGKKFNILAQEIAIGILLHYEEHGDYTALQYDHGAPWKGKDDRRAPRLYEVIGIMKSRSMQSALIAWICAHSSLRWNEDKKAFYHFKRDKRIQEGKAGYVDYAGLSVPFWTFEPEPAKPQAMSLDDILKIVKTMAERMVRLELEKINGKEVGQGDKKKTIAVNHAIPIDLLKDAIAFADKYGVAPKLPEEVASAIH